MSNKKMKKTKTQKTIKTISLEQLKRTLTKQDDAAFRLRNRQKERTESMRSTLLYGSAAELQTALTSQKIKDLVVLTILAEQAEAEADKLYQKVQTLEQTSIELLK